MRQFLLAPVVLAFAALAVPAQAAITLKLSGFQVGSVIGSGAANSASNSELSRTLQREVSAFGATPAVDNGEIRLDTAGQFGGTIDLGDGAGSKSFAAYCVELSQTFDPFPSTVPVVYTALSGGDYFSSSVAGNVGKLYSQGIVLDSADKTAAFQIALWEVIYEKSGVFAVGDAGTAGNADFSTYTGGTASAATFALAQSYLDALSTTSDNVTLTVYTNASQQDLIVAMPVPEPSANALMVAGLTVGLAGMAGAGLLRSRRR